MKKEFKFFWIGLGLATLLWLMLFVKTWKNSSEVNSHIITDTIYVDRPYKEIVIQKIEVPKKVFVYKTDTVFRKQIEKDTLITALEITPTIAKIHTITPKGLPIVQEYPLPEYRELKINPRGYLQMKKKKHKKFWKRTGQVGIFIGGFITANLIQNR